MRITLEEARRTGRLDEFVAQEEARGVVADREAFGRLVGIAVKPRRLEGQTSRSPSADGSSGT